MILAKKEYTYLSSICRRYHALIFQRDNQAFLSYDCEVALVTDGLEVIKGSGADYSLMSVLSNQLELQNKVTNHR